MGLTRAQPILRAIRRGHSCMSFTRLIATITAAVPFWDRLSPTPKKSLYRWFTRRAALTSRSAQSAGSTIRLRSRSAIRRPERYTNIHIPHVEVCFAKDDEERICQLTRQIVDKPMAVVINREIVSKPVVREQLCGPCFRISAGDLADANTLAQRVRRGTNRSCAPSA